MLTSNQCAYVIEHAVLARNTGVVKLVDMLLSGNADSITGKIMTDRPISSLPPVFTSLRLECALKFLILWPWLSTTAIGQGQTEESLATKSSIHATHVLGFEGERRNASGELSIQDGVVRFHRDSGQPIQLSINAIKTLSLSEPDNQSRVIPITS